MQYCVDFLHQNVYLELTKLLAGQKEGADSYFECGQKEVANSLIYAFKITDINLITLGIQAGATAACCLLVGGGGKN